MTPRWLMMGMLLAPLLARPEAVVGSYVGDGIAKQIEVGHAPRLVIIKGENSTVAVARSATLPGTKELQGIDTPLLDGGIDALGPTGFSIDADGGLNTPGVRYFYQSFDSVTVGRYAGDGVGGRFIDAGLSPRAVLMLSENSESAVVSVGGGSRLFGGSMTLNDILTLADGGFTVGTGSRVNAIGSAYSFIAFPTVELGVYVGTGFPQVISTSEPSVLVWLFGEAVAPCHRSAAGGQTLTFSAAPAFDDGITTLTDAGFEVGTHFRTNRGGTSYQWAAFSGRVVNRREDAGAVFDAGQGDAGHADAGQPDAGPSDAGEADASVPDASVPDSGVDGGSTTTVDGGVGEPEEPALSVGCSCSTPTAEVSMLFFVLLARLRRPSSRQRCLAR